MLLNCPQLTVCISVITMESAATPSPQRRVAERPDPIPEEDDEEVFILNVTPADTGFLGPILTKKPRKRMR